MKLRSLQLQDAPLMLEWMHDDSVVHDLHRDFSKLTLEDCENFIKKSLDSQDENLHLAIADDDTDEYMGTISLKNINIETKSAEFGITIRKAAMGKGYSKAAMAVILDKANTELGITKVYWCVDPVNQRALRFYDKNGYKRIQLQDEQELYTLVKESGDYSPSDIDRYVWFLYH
ncbi:MAG: GNAT family N-acetyltransferase [Butyrivibrio sp.]|uniref:GNAT family N-acetyltransferase n=1 Tax=Butyrivibrio sp. TaxID=28121 RepID=UPI0025C5950A|nr:GNAT family N-acetyltransferase [Butyrivibrio sp.]MBQ6587245.1 GNAT family N-acetyltransferase [Butyrivibrio sp.]